MSVIQLAEIIIGSIASLGIVFGGAGYLLQAFKGGITSERTDTFQLTQFRKEQISEFKEIVADLTHKLEMQKTDYNNQIKDLSNQLAEVNGRLIEKEKQLKETLAILNLRNPEMEKFMLLVTKSCNDQTEVNSKVTEGLTKMSEILSEIHTMAKQEHERDLNITAKITKT